MCNLSFLINILKIAKILLLFKDVVAIVNRVENLSFTALDHIPERIIWIEDGNNTISLTIWNDSVIFIT